jgi:hypothetical protein
VTTGSDRLASAIASGGDQIGGMAGERVEDDVVPKPDR